MKRIIIYIGVLAAVLMAPVKGSDVGTLKPVEVVLICKEKNDIIIETDTGDWGKGDDAKAALQNLKDTTAGHVYLDTAEYLIITEETQEVVEEIRPVLKKSLQMCYADGKIDLIAAAKFLPVHGKLIRLKDWKTGVELRKLTCIDERLKLS